MCLDRMADFKPCRIGYKVMALDGDGGFLFPLAGQCGRSYDKGRWLQEQDCRNPEFSDDDMIRTHATEDRSRFPLGGYPFGFHVFHTYEGAMYFAYMGGYAAADGDGFRVKMGYSIMRVEVASPAAVGYQHGRRVTVALRLRLIAHDRRFWQKAVPAQ